MVSHQEEPSKTVVGPPTPSHIQLVQSTWQRVAEIRHPEDDRNVSPSLAFAFAFYDALFTMDNSLQESVFNNNMVRQARVLTGILSYVVRSPTTSTTVFQQPQDDQIRRLTALGARHAQYNVQPYMIDLVGPALVIALKKRLKSEYRPEIGEAWWIVRVPDLNEIKERHISSFKRSLYTYMSTYRPMPILHSI